MILLLIGLPVVPFLLTSKIKQRFRNNLFIFFLSSIVEPFTKMAGCKYVYLSSEKAVRENFILHQTQHKSLKVMTTLYLTLFIGDMINTFFLYIFFPSS